MRWILREIELYLIFRTLRGIEMYLMGWTLRGLEMYDRVQDPGTKSGQRA